VARRRKRKVAAKRKPKRRRTLYERLKDYPLPPLPPEQAQAFKEIAGQTRAAQARAVVYNTELLDRMLAAEVSGRAPAPAPKKKRRKKRPPGRPPDYEYDKMERVAEDYIQAHGLPGTASLLMEKVEDGCNAAQPRITVPGDTQFKQFVRAIHRRHKRRRLAQGRKVEK